MLENRIDRITVKNFRSLKEVSVELDDLTVLVGPNGSGKSNFLDVLSLVRDGLKMGLHSAIRAREDFSHSLHFSHSFNTYPDTLEDIEIEIHLTLNGVQGIFGFVLHSTNTFPYRVRLETYQLGSARLENRDGTLESTIPLRVVIQEDNLVLPLISGVPELASVYEYLSKMQFHSIFQADFRYLFKGVGYLSEKSRNIEDVLAELDKKSIAEIGDILGSIVPGISKEDTIKIILAYGHRLNLVTIRHQIGDLPLSQESDGTLRLLALLTALYQRPAPALMAFEEPEVFIHPPATSYLTELMEEASLRGQVIVSTHSPDFIARFPPESLRVFEMVDGATQISPLRADQMQSIKEHLFDAGELLQIEGLKRG